ncbi:hypothetical protein ACFLV9_00140 [Chloroflexota bacterium]
MSAQCEYTKNGKFCHAYAILGSKYCFAHDPANAKKRAEARKKGGLHRRVIKRTQQEYHPIKSVKDVNTILESAINEARSLECTQSNLRTLAYLCQIALKGQELGNLEERINVLETQTKQKEKKYVKN